MEWISVEDRLPDLVNDSWSDYVVVYCPNQNTPIQEGPVMTAYRDNLGRWRDYEEFTVNPTHWMPLPDPPESE